jgi:hypothetical protein
MMPGCPLPVDWLDYLDGDRPDLKTHLDECLACHALVASLREQPVTSIKDHWAKSYIGNLEAVWHEDRPAMPALAEFWFSASDFALSSVNTLAAQTGSTFSYEGVDRLLLLVVSHPDNDHNTQWLDVVPVLSDVERATETDVLFEADENSLGTPWRALFAHQCKVARGQLDTRVGSLREAGQMVLTAAFNGSLDERRWGAPLQHPADPRAFLGQELDEAFLRLRTPWLLVCEADDADEAARGPYLVRDVLPQPSETRPDANVFWLTPVEEPPPQLALAAASSAEQAKEFWALDSEDFKLVGRLHVDFAKGLLLFAIVSIELKRAKRLRLHLVAFGETHESEVFAPEPDVEVPLAEQVPIEAVESIAAEVLP